MRYFRLFVPIVLSVLYVTAVHAQGASVFFTNAISFGSVDSGQTVLKPLIISDKYDTVHAVHGRVSLPTNSVFTLLSSDTFSVAAGTIDTLWIQYTSSTVGFSYDTLYITHDGNTRFTRNPARLSLKAQGLPSNDTSARIQIVSFATPRWRDTIGHAPMGAQPFIFRNTTDTSIRRLYGRIAGIAPPFSVVNSTFDIADSAFDTLWFNFSATDSGIYRDTVWLVSNANKPNDSIPILLTGSVVPAPTTPSALVTPNRIQFASMMVGSAPVTKFAILINTSSGFPLEYSLDYEPAQPFTVTMKPGPVETLTNDTMFVLFNPTFPGSFTDSIVLTTNASAPYTHINVQITGTATAPASVLGEAEASGVILRAFSDAARGVCTAHIELAKPGALSLDLFDAAGRNVEHIYNGLGQSGVNTFECSTAHLADGLYFLRLRSETANMTAKVIVTH